MAQIRSKQISDFLSSIQWANVVQADNVKIANVYDVKQQFDVVDASVNSLESYISTEVVSLEVIDAGLAADIQTEKDRIDAMLSLSTTDSDSFKEIVDLIASVDTENDQAFAGHVLEINASVDSLEAQISTEISTTNTEVTALQGKSANTDSALEDEIARATGRENEIEAALQAEINTTNLEVNALDASVNSLELIDADLQSQLNSEIATTNAEQDAQDASIDSLEGNVSSIDVRLGNVSGDLVGSVDSLEVALAAEISATNVDVNDLGEAINAEATRAGQSEDAIAEALAAEISATNADFVSIDTRVSLDENALAAEIAETAIEQAAQDASINSLEVVDGTLSARIESEKDRIDAMLSLATADADTFQGSRRFNQLVSMLIQRAIKHSLVTRI